jgi:predicted  nucleic acid-binding Zn-ribbon protein
MESEGTILLDSLKRQVAALTKERDDAKDAADRWHDEAEKSEENATEAQERIDKVRASLDSYYTQASDAAKKKDVVWEPLYVAASIEQILNHLPDPKPDKEATSE